MEKFLNPWALEVMKRHPEISICDQWQFVKDHEKDLYNYWWYSKDVHFGSGLNDPLGRFLAEHVANVMDMNPGAPPAAKAASKSGAQGVIARERSNGD